MIRTHDETSEALLAAAHRLLSTEGPDALTVRRIATEAGMSTMNVYSRFGGKDGVIDELYAEGFQRLTEAIDSVPTTGDAIGDLAAAAIQYRRFAVENPQYYEIMFGSLATARAGTAGIEGFRNRLERAAADRSVDLPDDLDAAAVWLWATCHGMVSLELNGTLDGTADWPDVYENGVRAVLSGVAPTSGAAAER